MRFRSHRAALKRFITAKHDGVCSETGKAIEKGQEIVYDPVSKLAFHQDSQTAQSLRAEQFAQAWNMSDANY